MGKHYVRNEDSEIDDSDSEKIKRKMRPKGVETSQKAGDARAANAGETT